MGMRPGRWALKTSRWQKIRRQALHRDGHKCQKCGYLWGLEVHHMAPVSDHPERAFQLSNLLTLCKRCHSEETAKELGHHPDPERRAWRDAVAELAKPHRAKRRKSDA